MFALFLCYKSGRSDIVDDHDERCKAGFIKTQRECRMDTIEICLGTVMSGRNLQAKKYCLGYSSAFLALGKLT